MDLFSRYFRIIHILLKLINSILNDNEENLDISDLKEIKARTSMLARLTQESVGDNNYHELLSRLRDSHGSVSFILRCFNKNNISHRNIKRIEEINKINKELAIRKITQSEAKEQYNNFSSSHLKIKKYLPDRKKDGDNSEKIRDEKLRNISLELKNRSLEAELANKEKIIADLELFNKSLEKTASASIEIAIGQIRKDAESKISEVDAFVNSQLPEAKNRLNSLNALNGIEGGQLLARHFQRAAFWEYLAAYIFRFTVILMLTGIAYFSYSSIQDYLSQNTKIADTRNSENDKNIEDDRSKFLQNNLILLLTTKISIIFIILGASSWLAKESTKHKNRANFLSNKSIALNTIDLYIAPFTDDQKNTLKIELARYFFANELSQPDNDKDGIGINPQEIANKIIDKVNFGRNS